MRGLTASDLFRIEDQCDERSPLDVAGALLHCATGVHADEVTLGQRDALLLTLRRLTIGSKLSLFSDCPKCRLELSAETTTDALILTAEEAAPSATVVVGSGRWPMRLRPATAADLRAALAMPDPRAALAALCLEPLDDAPFPSPQDLDADDLDQIAAAMAALDPQSDLLMGFVCPACGHDWSVIFDIADYFWRELQLHTATLLDDVHRLASAYHWSETEIMALAPSRRNAYLARIRG